LKTEQDPSSEYAFLYDADGHLAVSDNSGTPGAPHLVLTYSFDGFGNRTGWQDNYGGLLTLGYNADNDLTSENLTVSGTQGPQVTLSYDAQERLTGETRFVTSGGSKVTEALSYDNADRLTTITYSSSQVGALATFAYGYDNASQLTSYGGPEGSLTYTYDNSSELTGVGGARSESFQYDLNGNRNSSGYTTAAGNELTGDGTYTYAYDSEGNQVSKTRLSDNEQWSFTWDYRNRMTQAVEKTSAGVTVTNDVFTYDVEDRRIGKSTNGTQVWYGYSDVVAPTGSTAAQSNSYIDFNSSGSVSMRYLQRLGLDTMLGRFDGTNVGWYLTDNVGSIRLIVNPSGTVLDQVTYYAFGGIQNESNSSNGDRFKFTGREFDSEIGQQYNRARYYDPKAGRWTAPDPVAFDGGDPNLFRYVYGNATNASDPSGLTEIYSSGPPIQRPISAPAYWDSGIKRPTSPPSRTIADIAADWGERLQQAVANFNYDASTIQSNLGQLQAWASAFPGNPILAQGVTSLQSSLSTMQTVSATLNASQIQYIMFALDRVAVTGNNAWLQATGQMVSGLEKQGNQIQGAQSAALATIDNMWNYIAWQFNYKKPPAKLFNPPPGFMRGATPA
jgi:RHS repeat-associated protein